MESIKCRFKEWRFFNKVVSNNYIPHLEEFLRIVSAISNEMNRYRSQPACSQCDIQLVKEMLKNSRQGSLAKAVVKNEELLKKGAFIQR